VIFVIVPDLIITPSADSGNSSSTNSEVKSDISYVSSGIWYSFDGSSDDDSDGSSADDSGSSELVNDNMHDKALSPPSLTPPPPEQEKSDAKVKATKTAQRKYESIRVDIKMASFFSKTLNNIN